MGGAEIPGGTLSGSDPIDGVPTRGRDVSHSFSDASCANGPVPSLMRVLNHP